MLTNSRGRSQHQEVMWPSVQQGAANTISIASGNHNFFFYVSLSRGGAVGQTDSSRRSQWQ